MPQLWILKTKGNQSAFGGNTGYDDNPTSHYVYDTTVPNHDKLQEQDFVVIANKKYILGFAQVESIKVERQLSKIRYSCPICGTNEFYSRKGKFPPYRCRNKHEFGERTEKEINIDRFTAVYTNSFRKWECTELVKVLEPYYVKRNLYYSIQAANIDFLKQRILDLGIVKTFNTELNEQNPKQTDVRTIPEYIFNDVDERSSKLGKTLAREGQEIFKNHLIKIYGPVCMISEICIPIAIQASHIVPYRGIKDNNPRNGLLLRADLHLLYDSDLIGINPINFEVKLHSSIKNSYYQQYDGKKLKIGREDFSPSNRALTFRWDKFQLKIKRNG